MERENAMTPTEKPADHAAAAAPSADLSKLSPAVRWTRAMRALAHILANPEATDKVIEFLQLANTGALRRRATLFFADPRGARLYAEQRKIDSRTVDVDRMLALPAGTLGHAYATFLRSHGLTPEVFDEAPTGVPDPRLSYMIQRTRQTHDLWHVVTGCETDPAGEVALQAFTYAQVRAPGNAILALAGALKGARQKPGIMRDVVALFRTGARANRLPVFPWEDHWATPLTEVRALLGLPAQPLRRHAA
jgi:ubiquinone biosynthesis protein COQ4